MGECPPQCIGGFETGDPECNGSSSDPRPCVWRDKCGAFRAHLQKTRAGLGRWVDTDGELVVDAFKFDQDCRAWVELYQVVDGLPAGEKPAPTMAVDELFDAFERWLLAEVDRELVAGKLALPGQLFVVDRRERYGYETIYCRAPRGLDRPLAQICIRRKVSQLVVRLPVSAAVVARAGLDVVVLDRRRGQFRSETYVDEHNAQAFATKLGGLVESGELKLPQRPA